MRCLRVATEKAVKLSTWDYTLAMLGQKMAPLLCSFGNMESDLKRARLRQITIDRPLFISGLARSGTTILLNLLAQSKGVATHRYRDFPFVWMPLTWNWFQDRMASTQLAVERPHRDRIRITKESPDAFEEPIWQHYFPWVHDPERNHVLDDGTDSPDFEDFFADHIRKILLIRGAERYVSKGNYNISRFAYLARLLPDARFIVPVRAPLAQVHSLVKQHRLFTDYAAGDPRVPNYLRAAGHYEFGPQRQPINLSRSSGDRVLEAWRSGDDYRGYAVLWAEVYAHVQRLTAAGSKLAQRNFLVRYEDFCADPRSILSRILDFAQLTEQGAQLLDRVGDISAPPNETTDLTQPARDAVRDETQEVAAQLGYEQ